MARKTCVDLVKVPLSGEQLLPDRRQPRTETMATPVLDRAPVSQSARGEGRDAPPLVIGRLYEQHFRMIRALCQLLLRDPAEAEDAAQQTFLSAFGSLIGGTVPKLPAAWLATIARRECWSRSAQRSAAPVALHEANAPSSMADGPLEKALRNFDLNALWTAVDALPRQQRRAFLMREFSGLSYAEVAVALGATESAIETLLVRARRQLRDGLAPTLRASNAIASPILLLPGRFMRLLQHGESAGFAAGASVPVAAKLGATLVGVLTVGAAGVGMGAGSLRLPWHPLANPTSGSKPVPGIGSHTSWNGPLARSGSGPGRRDGTQAPVAALTARFRSTGVPALDGSSVGPAGESADPSSVPDQASGTGAPAQPAPETDTPEAATTGASQVSDPGPTADSAGSSSAQPTGAAGPEPTVTAEVPAPPEGSSAAPPPNDLTPGTTPDTTTDIAPGQAPPDGETP